MELENLEIAPQDIILNPFTYTIVEEGKPEENDNITPNLQNMPDIQKQKLTQFLSTPKFIKCLTQISERLGLMREASKAEKKEILK